jgi:DNA-binding winged helix-turn-helix (wHTH) protein
VEPVDSSWAIGEWTFRPLLNRLSRDGQHVRLEPKVSDLLLFLALRARQPVSKDAIFEGVWDQKFLGDSALTRTMAELRRALGDDARTPIYVETIPKHGYRLIAETRRLDDRAGPTAVPVRGDAAKAVSARREPDWRRLAPWIGAALLLAALASLVAVPTFRPTIGASPEALGPDEAAQGALKLVAVLPLQDLSLADPSEGPETGDRDDSRNFFAAGMTEALVAHLAQTGAVGVISTPWSRARCSGRAIVCGSRSG